MTKTPIENLPKKQRVEVETKIHLLKSNIAYYQNQVNCIEDTLRSLQVSLTYNQSQLIELESTYKF